MAASVVYTHFGGQIVSENRGGVKRDYVPDTLGSTIALVDSTGAITDTWKYWPYGEVSSRTGTNPTPFTFVGTLGYFKDLASKLTYVRARIYQAFTGQWMTMDPLWPRQDRYTYTSNNPIGLVDPTGLTKIDWLCIFFQCWPLQWLRCVLFCTKNGWGYPYCCVRSPFQWEFLYCLCTGSSRYDPGIHKRSTFTSNTVDTISVANELVDGC